MWLRLRDERYSFGRTSRNLKSHAEVTQFSYLQFYKLRKRKITINNKFLICPVRFQAAYRFTLKRL